MSEQADFERIEDQLMRLRPTPVAQRVEDQIAQRLSVLSRQRNAERLRRWLYRGSAIAAAILLFVTGGMLMTGRLTTNPSTVPEEGHPGFSQDVAEGDGSATSLKAENQLFRKIDEGVVFLDSGLGARQYRYQFIDRIVWKDPESGDVLEWKVPREEVFLVPLQTY
jgi:hypothetical protein